MKPPGAPAKRMSCVIQSGAGLGHFPQHCLRRPLPGRRPGVCGGRQGSAPDAARTAGQASCAGRKKLTPSSLNVVGMHRPAKPCRLFPVRPPAAAPVRLALFEQKRGPERSRAYNRCYARRGRRGGRSRAAAPVIASGTGAVMSAVAAAAAVAGAVIPAGGRRAALPQSAPAAAVPSPCAHRLVPAEQAVRRLH